VKGFPETKFTWENYGVAWETDHLWGFEKVDRTKIWHRFKVMHWSNLRPETAQYNKRRRAMLL
jgi:hypothetical protein